MHPHSNIITAFDDSFLILDEEFDKTEINLAPEYAPGLPGDDRGWEDQLDEGNEMSL